MASAKRKGRRSLPLCLWHHVTSRNAHVAELIEAAYASIETDASEPTGAPALAFSQIQTPVDPNGAALPILNGRVFTNSVALVAEGDEGSKAD